jgi:hypothetical protein
LQGRGPLPATPCLRPCPQWLAYVVLKTLVPHEISPLIPSQDILFQKNTLHLLLFNSSFKDLPIILIKPTSISNVEAFCFTHKKTHPFNFSVFLFPFLSFFFNFLWQF